MPRWMKVVMIAAATVLSLSLAALVVLGSVARSRPPTPTAPERGVEALALPDFSLVDQGDAPVTLADFKGRVTICDFFFTHCPFICPRLTAQMADMNTKLGDANVRLASFSVDPERDTPARLREYAAERGLDLKRWRLITGPHATIEGIVKGALKFEMAPDPKQTVNLPDGTTMQNITHPGHFVLIGPDGRVLAMRRSSDPEGVNDMVRLAREAASTLR